MKSVFAFLKEIKENNNREWFATHKSEYDSIVKENKVFFDQIYSPAAARILSGGKLD